MQVHCLVLQVKLLASKVEPCLVQNQHQLQLNSLALRPPQILFHSVEIRIQQFLEMLPIKHHQVQGAFHSVQIHKPVQQTTIHLVNLVGKQHQIHLQVTLHLANLQQQQPLLDFPLALLRLLLLDKLATIRLHLEHHQQHLHQMEVKHKLEVSTLLQLLHRNPQHFHLGVLLVHQQEVNGLLPPISFFIGF